MTAKEPHPHNQQEQTAEEHSLDGLARSLADATLSRQRVLKLAGGAMLGGALSFLALPEEAVAKNERKRQRRRARRRADAALDRALQELVDMPGGPPGVISIVQRGTRLRIHQFGIANLSNGQSPRITDHMRIASAAKAFSGATHSR